MTMRGGGRTCDIILVVLATGAVCKTSGVPEPTDLTLDDIDAGVVMGGTMDGGEEDGEAENQGEYGGEDDDEQLGIDLLDT